MFDPVQLFNGAVDITGPASACSWAVGRLDAFFRSSGGRLGHVWWDQSFPENTRWRREEFSNTVPADLAVCSMGPARIDLFWRNSPSSLSHKSFSAAGWLDLPTIAATPGGPPAVCSWGPNRIDLFWQEDAGALHHRWWDGRTWENDEIVPGPVTSDIATCSWGPDRLDVFWREPSGSLGHLWREGSATWNRWSHPAAFVGRPAACCQAPGVIDILVRNPDGALWHYWWDFNAWSGWHRRPGEYAFPPSLTSWGDGRLDFFLTGLDHKLWFATDWGQPVHTRPVKTIWQFGHEDRRTDKAFRLLHSFAAGALPGCSGAMVSPHFFLTAGHCGGTGHIKPVQFFHIDPFKSPGVDGSQQLSEGYIGRGWTWASWGPGDSQLFWLPDGPDGVPPGIRYGYQEISARDVEVGTEAYSFWVNSAVRLPQTLLFSDGRATVTGADPPWLGDNTQYDLWTRAGGSGSTVLAPSHGHCVVGTTQGGPSDGQGGPWRAVPDASAFVSRFDADRNAVLDAIEYDWLVTRPYRDVVYARFDLPLEQSRWVAVPGGSATSTVGSGPRIHNLTGYPEMTANATDRDGYWEQTSRFVPGRTYRISVKATALGGNAPTGYVKFRSDRSGHEVMCRFRVGLRAVEAGILTLGSHDDYRLILGVGPDSSIKIWEMVVLSDHESDGRPVVIGFDTHDARRTWNYAGDCRPASCGVRAAQGFSAAVVGPSSEPGGIWNHHLGLHTSRSYSIRFATRTVAAAEPPDQRRCWLRLLNQRPGSGGYHVVYEYRWSSDTLGAIQSHNVSCPSSSLPVIVAFGRDGDGAYLVGDLSIEMVA